MAKGLAHFFCRLSVQGKLVPGSFEFFVKRWSSLSAFVNWAFVRMTLRIARGTLHASPTWQLAILFVLILNLSV